MIENSLLAYQFTDHQELVVPVPSCGQKTATTGDQGINADKVPLQMAEPLLDRLSNLADARAFIISHCKKLLPGFLSMRSWLLAKLISDWRMHRVNQFLRDFSGFIGHG